MMPTITGKTIDSTKLLVKAKNINAKKINKKDLSTFNLNIFLHTLIQKNKIKNRENIPNIIYK